MLRFMAAPRLALVRWIPLLLRLDLGTGFGPTGRPV
jgi:hypothetical protein